LEIPGDIELVELLRPRLRNPVMIQGLPGLGFVGKVTVEYLIEKLAPVKFAELFSTHLTLPDGNLGINVEFDGTYALPKYEFHHYNGRNQDLVLLTGDAQPNAFGQYEVAARVVDFAREIGCARIVAIGGYGTRTQSDIGLVYAITNDSSLAQTCKGLGAHITQGGVVTGACGVILGVAAQKRMECLGLLGATRGVFPDVEAARSVVRILCEMFDLRIETKDLDEEVSDIKAKLEYISRVQSELLGEKKTGEKFGYIA